MKSNADFNLIARPYRWLEYLTLGRALERCRLHFIPRLLHQKKALVFGDGDGRFLAALMAANPSIHADAIDTSATMLHLLRRRCECSALNATVRLQTHHADALAFTPIGRYDLVATHFFLDCLTQIELEALITRIIPSLSHDAFWVVSDFRVPSGPMRLPSRVVIRILYFAFRILTGLRTTRLPDHAAPMSRAGLVLTAHHHSLAGLLTTELWQYQNKLGT